MVHMERRGVAVLALVTLALLSTINAQEHAPTLAVCRADVAVWGNVQAETDYNNAETARVTNDVPNRTAIAKLSVKEVISRIREMVQCIDVDPDQEDSYYNVQEFYHSVQADCWRAFIVRHQLLSQ